MSKEDLLRIIADLNAIYDRLPPVSRQVSVAKTKLDEARLWLRDYYEMLLRDSMTDLFRN